MDDEKAGKEMLGIRVLGCGTSTGVPVIGCECRVCTSSEPYNRRLRCGLYLTWNGKGVLVDTPTDLRQQALRYGVERVDGVLFTHAHADHIFGLDEVRIFNFRQQSAIPCYGSAPTLEQIRRTFAYIFEPGQEGGGKPKLELVEIDRAFSLFGREIMPIPVLHGHLPVLGFRLGRFAYVTDCNHIPETSYDLLQGLEVLILDALHYNCHPTHFSVEEALAAADRIGAGQTYLTHLSHKVDYRNPEVPLPDGVEFAYDGLELETD